MTQMQQLKNILELIHNHTYIPIQQLNGILNTDQRKEIVLKLLITVNNLSIIRQEMPFSAERKMRILEDIIQCISSIVLLPQPAQGLVKLDRRQFVNQCCRKDSHRMLINKSVGIFPPMQKEDNKIPKIMSYQLQQSSWPMIGNQNWILTRSVLANWYKIVKNNLTDQQNISMCILLAKDELVDLTKGNSWNSIWSYLYLWYNDSLFEVCTGMKLAGRNKYNSQKIYVEGLNQAKNDIADEVQKMMIELILFIVRQFFCQDGQHRNMNRCFQIFQTMNYKQFDQIWHYLLFNQLFSQIASQQQLQQISQSSSKLMKIIKSKISQNNFGQSINYFLPKLYTQTQFIQYVRNKQIKFWIYGYEHNSTEIIAINQLESGDLNQENVGPIVTHLKCQDFIQKILKRRTLETEQSEIIVQIVGKLAKQLGIKIKQYLSIRQQQAVKGLKVFAQQWTFMHSLRRQGINDNNFHEGLNLLGKETHLSTNFTSNCLLPKDNSALISKLLDKMIEYVLQNQEGNINKFINLLCSSAFTKVIDCLGTSQLDRFWHKSNAIFMKNNPILTSLLAIPPRNEYIEIEEQDDFQIFDREAAQCIVSIALQEYNSDSV